MALRTNVLPAAQRAFEAATEGYRQGKFGYLEVLDAQRTLFDTRGRYLTASRPTRRQLPTSSDSSESRLMRFVKTRIQGPQEAADDRQPSFDPYLNACQRFHRGAGRASS